MSNKIAPLEKSIQELSNKYHIVSYDLYKGIKLAFMSLTGNKHTDTHEPLRHILEINYCHKGRIGWKMSNGNSVYLGEHDFSLHTMEYCSNSTITLPNEYYEGITIYIDDYSLVIAPVVADLCTTPVALSAPPNSYQNNSQS